MIIEVMTPSEGAILIQDGMADFGMEIVSVRCVRRGGSSPFSKETKVCIEVRGRSIGNGREAIFCVGEAGRVHDFIVVGRGHASDTGTVEKALEFMDSDSFRYVMGLNPRVKT